MNLIHLKEKMKEYYCSENDNKEEKKFRKKVLNKKLEEKNSNTTLRFYEEKLNQISLNLNSEIIDTSVTFYPSYKFKIPLHIEKIKTFHFVKEIYVSVSNLEKFYTAFIVNSVAEKFKIENKTKYHLYKPLILSEGMDEHHELLARLKNEIEKHWEDYSFINIKRLLGHIDVVSIAYTTNKNNLFNALFGSFDPSNYKLV